METRSNQHARDSDMIHEHHAISEHAELKMRLRTRRLLLKCRIPSALRTASLSCSDAWMKHRRRRSLTVHPITTTKRARRSSLTESTRVFTFARQVRCTQTETTSHVQTRTWTMTWRALPLLCDVFKRYTDDTSPEETKQEQITRNANTCG